MHGEIDVIFPSSPFSDKEMFVKFVAESIVILFETNKLDTSDLGRLTYNEVESYYQVLLSNVFAHDKRAIWILKDSVKLIYSPNSFLWTSKDGMQSFINDVREELVKRFAHTAKNILDILAIPIDSPPKEHFINKYFMEKMPSQQLKYNLHSEHDRLHLQKIQDYIDTAVTLFNEGNKKAALDQVAKSSEILGLMDIEDSLVYDLKHRLFFIDFYFLFLMGNPEPLLILAEEIVGKLESGNLVFNEWMDGIWGSAGIAATILGDITKNNNHLDWALWFFSKHEVVTQKYGINDPTSLIFSSYVYYLKGEKQKALDGFKRASQSASDRVSKIINDCLLNLGINKISN